MGIFTETAKINKGLTVQQLCDKLQMLAHHGYAQSEVKVNILDGYYNIGKDILKHTIYKDDGENVVFLIEGVPA